MSEPGPESLPTSADPRSKRPTKRRAVTPRSEHANQVETLFKDPSKDIKLPAASSEHKSSLLAPPEIVTNVQGSSAGAGSGEFHVYKASRRREYERLQSMQSEVDKEKDDARWKKEREEAELKDKEKTDKNRRRRAKKKNAREKKKDDVMVDTPPVETAPAPGTMVVDDKNGDVADGQPAQEVPGVIIHDDD